jgi:ligand-binding sensor domain-containing protein
MAAGGWGTGVWLSSDTGKTWEAVGGNLPSPNLTAMLFDFHTAGRLWVSTFEKGTFFTDNSGAEWSDPELVGAYIFDLGYL